MTLRNDMSQKKKDKKTNFQRFPLIVNENKNKVRVRKEKNMLI